MKAVANFFSYGLNFIYVDRDVQLSHFSCKNQMNNVVILFPERTNVASTVPRTVTKSKAKTQFKTWVTLPIRYLYSAIPLTFHYNLVGLSLYTEVISVMRNSVEFRIHVLYLLVCAIFWPTDEAPDENKEDEEWEE